MLVVWGRKNSINVQKVMWCIGELDLAHERKDVGGPFGGLDTEEYGALNPNRRIPTVVDGDGTTVWESHSCVRYIAARYGAGSLWPEDPSARARADLWLDWMQTTLLPEPRAGLHRPHPHAGGGARHGQDRALHPRHGGELAHPRCPHGGAALRRGR